MYVSKLVRSLEEAGLVRRAEHPGDPRAFELGLTTRGADQTERAAAVMRDLFDQLLVPIGGRTGKRNAALMETLDKLLDQAEAFNAVNGPQAQEEPRRRRPRAARREHAS
jgi:DNA-binding MarR family transcriptional regulator